MNYRFFVGTDVSKDKLDVVMLDAEKKELVNYSQLNNDRKGVWSMMRWLESLPQFSHQQALYCLEHTGVYNYPLLKEATIRELNVWLENPMQIKRSLGLQRGKNDKTDAQRIAAYAMQNQDKAVLWKAPREVVDKIRLLLTQRNNLIDSKNRLLVPIEENRQMGRKDMATILEKSIAKTIRAMEKDIDSIEKQIHQAIDGDDHLKKLYGLITSVVGIGFVTAVNLIIYTNEFKWFADARKLACYCGVAPFEHSSGSSIRGRPRVSHFANKKLKTNLHMGAMQAARWDPELKNYFDRKVAEGKNKMSVLNAIRNKLIHRVIAVVKRGTEYVKLNQQNDLVIS